MGYLEAFVRIAAMKVTLGIQGNIKTCVSGRLTTGKQEAFLTTARSIARNLWIGDWALAVISTTGCK
jgi:hypothetical protein